MTNYLRGSIYVYRIRKTARSFGTDYVILLSLSLFLLSITRLYHPTIFDLPSLSLAPFSLFPYFWVYIRNMVLQFEIQEISSMRLRLNYFPMCFIFWTFILCERWFTFLDILVSSSLVLFVWMKLGNRKS